MNPFASYRLLITPLSPIHVGTGESYEPTNYVIEDGVLHEFDTGAAMSAMTQADRDALLGITNRAPNTEMIKALQQFFHERRRPLMAHAIARVPVLSGVANLYANRVGQAANREANGGQVLNRLEIDRTSFNTITRLPVLYGSSMKGAIRTALLDGLNGGAALQKVEDRRTKRWRDENNQELQQRLFQYQAGKFELDPLRLVQLADAAWTGESGLPAAQVHLAVNRKKEIVKDKQGVIRKSQAETQELYQILECVSGWRYRAFTGQINLQSVADLDEKDRRGSRQLPAVPFRFDVVQIANACNDFYIPILNGENKLMRDRGLLDPGWDKAIQQIFVTARERLKRGEAFLLRVGRHSGAESVTLNGVRNIRIMKGRGQPPEFLEEAKTLWLAADEKDQTSKLLPFGWLLVELQPFNAPATDWPELQSTCEPFLVFARSFAGKLAAQQSRLAQARVEAEAKRHDEEELTRFAAEAAAQRQREEGERQARMETMTENLRRVEDFKTAFAERHTQLRGKFDRQNTDYHDRARKLAKDALEGADWTPEEKHAAATAIGEWLPKVVERIDKDQLKKLKLNALRGQA
ncbi:CRISPR-associated protein Csm5 [Gammaproteobacteria bacterium]